MDGYQFLASILQSLVSLAWPIAFVIAVALFREKLTQLLPFLRVKLKDTEVSFRLDQAEKESAQIPKAPPSPDLEPTPEEKSRYERIAEHSPRAAILEKRAELEQVLRSVAEPYLTETSPRSWKTLSLTSAIRVLRNHKVIDEKTSALLDDLRTIGNRAAHRADGNEFTKDEAIRFGKLADDTIALIRLLE
jgi:Domain of unknown function (DUF4145)